MELDEITIAELQRLMVDGKQTSRSITQGYLDQIAALDRQGPRLGSIIETNPDALEIAEALDIERHEVGPRGPLHGVPIVLKDNIDTHDRMTTTAGSLALEGSIAPRDSFIASQLRNAGAVLLAKANMSEWAYFRGTNATSGWSARGGQCRNPYDLDRNPCGSSSGSAVAVAANLTAAAIGTETNGSILCPSSVNGIVGLKPTVGLWSQSGIIPISHSQDTAGPMTRTVADAAAVLDAVTGADTRQAAGYSSFLDVEGLAGARIGVARSFDGFDASTLERFEEALAAMDQAGATLLDPVTVEPATWADDQPLVVLEYEFKAGLNAYLASLGSGAPVRSLADVIDFNERHAATELAHFGQQRLIAAQARGSLADAEYLEAKDVVQQLHRHNLDGVLSGELLTVADGAGPLDAIVMPSRGPAWLTDQVNGDPEGGGSTAGPAAIAGYPNLTVPMGFVDGLPVGMSFVGRPWSEGTLLRLGYAYEQATQHRRPPTLTTASH